VTNEGPAQNRRTSIVLSAAYLGKETVEIVRTEYASPPAGHVQVRVAYVGLCGTDLHIAHGHMDGRVRTPLVFGHEMSGTVEAVGAEVEGWSAGDLVTVMPLVWDGTCPACLAGNSHICQNLTFLGIDSPGALQPLWNVPTQTLVRLPPGTDLHLAALVEPVAVAVHDVRRGQVDRGSRVVVLGGGPIGTLIACVARDLGAELVVIEPDAARRELVRELGFTAPDPTEHDVPAWVERWTEGAGADVVFEVSGAAAAVALTTGLAKVRGRIVVVAIHGEPRSVDLQRVFWRELELVGARVYQRQDFETAVELLRAHALPVEALITRTVPLSEVATALDDLAAGRAMKILVDVQAGQETTR
jgi:2-desacetyl-2-hydroxyethyl bacteriochlorophyllide A dehydrogenase